MNDMYLSCRELVELVTEYLDGALPVQDQSRFEEHIMRTLAVEAFHREGRLAEAERLQDLQGARLEQLAAALAGSCGAALLAGLLADVYFNARDAGGGARDAGTAAYIAAHAAGGGDKRAPGYTAGFEAERRWQVEWLAARLGLPSSAPDEITLTWIHRFARALHPVRP